MTARKKRTDRAGLPVHVCLGSEFFNGPDWSLVTDSQDTDTRNPDSIAGSYLSQTAQRYMRDNDMRGLFVRTGNAEYTAIYGYSGSVPYTYKDATRLYPFYDTDTI
jgi:hypothetical protein